MDSPGLPLDVRTWDVLTTRLLLLRALSWFDLEPRNDVDFEWVGKQTLRCLLNGGMEEEMMGQ